METEVGEKPEKATLIKYEVPINTYFLCHRGFKFMRLMKSMDFYH